MMKMIDEKRIEFLMKTLKISREEALDLEGYDENLKEGVKAEYDLSDEQEKVVREMNRKVEHAKGNGGKRERKPNELKEAIVREIADLLENEAVGQVYEDVAITNPNRMIAFSVNGKRFELTLTEKRPPKN
jgi:hypothetical protein